MSFCILMFLCITEKGDKIEARYKLIVDLLLFSVTGLWHGIPRIAAT